MVSKSSCVLIAKDMRKNKSTASRKYDRLLQAAMGIDMVIMAMNMNIIRFISI